MLSIRISKGLTVIAISFFAFLVVLNNITDYDTNFMFVKHVFLMDTTFPGNAIMYRAIDTPWVHHAGYIFIIMLELLTAILCFLGGVRLLCSLRTNSTDFHAAKTLSIVGLTLGFLTWQVGFMSIGGEWFGMWMSQTWNGVDSAFRFFITQLVILVYIAMANDG